MTGSAVELSDFCYVDVAGDMAKCKPFPAMSLAPDARYAQDIDDTVSGFNSAVTRSYARSPNVTGAFVTVTTQTKGAANP